MSADTEGLRDKWVAALRSGKYEQTDGQLRKGDGFCCLGVLCDIVESPPLSGQLPKP